MLDHRQKPARLRQTPNLRRLISETRLTADKLIMPLFFQCGTGTEEVPSMPGIGKRGEASLLREVEKLDSLGVKTVLLFGSTRIKDACGSSSYDPESPFHRVIQKIKRISDITVITDVCLCAYTNHGHCGVTNQRRAMKSEANGGAPSAVGIDGEKTLEALAKIAVSYAAAGADMVAPSAMADGQVKAIRESLDRNGFRGTPIMSYSAKYASSFYGPFRDIAGTHPSFGDRKTYQMDAANKKEAIRETLLDVEEGADIVMVKPALCFLDIISAIRQAVNVPVAAYNVSGEYAMLKAAAQKGWLDEKSAAMEMLTSIKRAGADIIITYWAKQAVAWLKD